MRSLRQFGHPAAHQRPRSEEHTSELQSQSNLVCRLLLEKKKKTDNIDQILNALVDQQFAFIPTLDTVDIELATSDLLVCLIGSSGSIIHFANLTAYEDTL